MCKYAHARVRLYVFRDKPVSHAKLSVQFRQRRRHRVIVTFFKNANQSYFDLRVT